MAPSFTSFRATKSDLRRDVRRVARELGYRVIRARGNEKAFRFELIRGNRFLATLANFLSIPGTNLSPLSLLGIGSRVKDIIAGGQNLVNDQDVSLRICVKSIRELDDESETCFWSQTPFEWFGDRAQARRQFSRLVASFETEGLIVTDAA